MRFSRGSEAKRTDFSHQVFGGKLAGTEELVKFSTFPQCLLLLLVLMVLHLI